MVLTFGHIVIRDGYTNIEIRRSEMGDHYTTQDELEAARRNNNDPKPQGKIKALWMTRDESFTLNIPNHTPISRGAKIGMHIERAAYEETATGIYLAARQTLNYLFEQERQDFLSPISILQAQEDLDTRVLELLAVAHGEDIGHVGASNESVDRIELSDGTVLTGSYAERWLESQMSGTPKKEDGDVKTT